MANASKKPFMKDGIRHIYQARKSARKGCDVWHYKVPFTTADGTATSETFTDKTEAENFRDKMRVRRSGGGKLVSLQAGKMAVFAYANQWLAAVSDGLAPGTVKTYRSLLDNHVLPVIGRAAMRDVTRTEVQQIITRMRKADLSASTIQGVRAVVGTMFNRAVTIDEVITTSPCRGIVMPPTGHRAVRILETHHVVSLAASIDPRYRALVLVAAGTGLRIGELLGLTWDRIDLDRATLTVDRQYKPTAHALTATKTRASVRTIPLGKSTVALLRHLHDACSPVPVTLPCVGHRKPQAVTLVFHDGDGNPLSYWQLDSAWKKARTAAGVPDWATWHTLRHYYVSLLIADGIHARVIQERVGHKSISTTMDVYGHLMTSHGDDTRTAVDNALGDL